MTPLAAEAIYNRHGTTQASHSDLTFHLMGNRARRAVVSLLIIPGCFIALASCGKARVPSAFSSFPILKRTATATGDRYRTWSALITLRAGDGLALDDTPLEEDSNYLTGLPGEGKPSNSPILTLLHAGPNQAFFGYALPHGVACIEGVARVPRQNINGGGGTCADNASVNGFCWENPLPRNAGGEVIVALLPTTTRAAWIYGSGGQRIPIRLDHGILYHAATQPFAGGYTLAGLGTRTFTSNGFRASLPQQVLTDPICN